MFLYFNQMLELVSGIIDQLRGFHLDVQVFLPALNGPQLTDNKTQKWGYLETFPYLTAIWKYSDAEAQNWHDPHLRRKPWKIHFSSFGLGCAAQKMRNLN